MRRLGCRVLVLLCLLRMLAGMTPLCVSHAVDQRGSTLVLTSRAMFASPGTGWGQGLQALPTLRLRGGSDLGTWGVDAADATQVRNPSSFQEGSRR